MKEFVVDYRSFRLSKINEPQFAHLKLLFGWVVYFVCYLLTENIISAQTCFSVHCVLDDWIPFNEWFIIPYVGWYFLIGYSLIYALLFDVKGFKGLQIFIIVVQLIATIIYVIFPSRQDLRPEVFPRNNFLTETVRVLYHVDTNTGVCPSLHVAISIGMASFWVKSRSASNITKCLIVLCAILICFSTVFVKQHSVLDCIAAVPVCLVAETIAFRHYYNKRHVKSRSNR